MYEYKLSALPEAVLGLDVGLDIPVEFVLALVILLVFGLSDAPHLLIVIVVKLVVSRFLLPKVDSEVLGNMVLLDPLNHLLLLQQLLIRFCEIEIGTGTRLLRLDDSLKGRVQALGFCERLVSVRVSLMDCSSQRMNVRGSLNEVRVTL